MNQRLSRARTLALLAAAPAAFVPRRSGAQEMPSLTIAGSTFDSSTQGMYAVKAGLFTKASLNVTFTPMSPAAIPPAIMGGTIQIANSNLFNVIEAHTRNIPFTLVAPSAMFDETDVAGYVGLIVRKDSTLKTGKDFSGKTIGVAALKDMNTLSSMAWIDANGGDSSTVKYVEVPSPATAAAIQAGRIDASVLVSPLLGQALDTGDIKILAEPYSSISKNYLGLGWITTTAYANANPAIIAKFAAVMRDAAVYCNAHQAETIDMMAELAKLDPATMRKIKRVKFASYVQPSMVQPVIDVALRYKVIDKGFNAQELISPYALKAPSR